MVILSLGLALIGGALHAEAKPTLESVEKRFAVVKSKAAAAERPRLDDIEIYITAHARLKDDKAKNAPALRQAMLDEAAARLDHMEGGRSPWVDAEGGLACLSYRSRVDGSLQPCAIFLPKGYHVSGKKWPVDVVLHGRSDGMTHASFLAAHSGGKKRI